MAGAERRVLDCVRTIAEAVLTPLAWSLVGRGVLAYLRATLCDLRSRRYRPGRLARLPRPALQRLARRHGVRADQMSANILAELFSLRCEPLNGLGARGRVLARHMARELALDGERPAHCAIALAACRRLAPGARRGPRCTRNPAAAPARRSSRGATALAGPHARRRLHCEARRHRLRKVCPGAAWR